MSFWIESQGHWVRGHSERTSKPKGEVGLVNPDKFGHRGRGCFRNPDVRVSRYWNETFQVSVGIDLNVKYSESHKVKITSRPASHKKKF